MTWRLIWTRPAIKDLKRLDRPVARRIREQLVRLAETGHGDVIRLTDIDPPAWRLRVGDWRVLFEYRLTDRAIKVLHVLGRSQVYKR